MNDAALYERCNILYSSEDGVNSTPIEENGVKYSFAVYKKQ